MSVPRWAWLREHFRAIRDRRQRRQLVRDLEDWENWERGFRRETPKLEEVRRSLRTARGEK